MPIEIELPGGDIAEFPDDMPDDQIEAALRNEFSDIKVGPTPEFRGPEVRQTPDYGLTTRGGPPISIPEGGEGVFNEGFETLGDTLSYAGNVARSIPADVAAGLSLLKRPEGQKVGLLPASPSTIRETIQKNLPYAAQASGNIPAAIMGEPRAELPIDLQLSEAATEGSPGAVTAATVGRLSQDLAATSPLLAIGLLPKTVQSLAALGFGIHMMAGAPALFNEYADEINKPEEEQDPDKIAKLQSGIMQTFGFAPLATKHGVSGFAKEFGVAWENANRNAPGPKTGGLRASDQGPPPVLQMPMQIEKGGETEDASKVTKAAEVYGDVRSQRQAEVGQVPTEEGVPRVQPEAERGVLSPDEHKEFQGLRDKFFKGGEMTSEELDMLDSFDARNRELMQARVVANPVDLIGESAELVRDAIKKEGVEGKVVIIEGPQADPGSPMHGRVAQFNTDTGRLEISAEGMAQELAGTPVEKRAEMAHRIINEEHIHSHTTPEEAADFGAGLSSIERSIGQRIYLGKRGSGVRQVLGDEISDQALGWEVIRRRVQRLNRLSPTEMVAAAGRERWTLESLDLLDRVVAKSREFLGTDASKAQKAIFDKVTSRIDMARKAIKSGAVAGAGPRESEVERPAAPQRAEEETKPKVAKMGQAGGMVGDRKNPFGDPANTTYHATPADWSTWQELLGKKLDFDTFGQRETIKNKYGGMPPEPPVEMPAAMSRKDAQRLEELRKYNEAMGKRPETKRTTGLGEAVAPEERVGTTEFGLPPEQMPRTAADFDVKADQILASPIKPRKAKTEIMGEKTYQKWKRKQMILGEKAGDLEMRAQFSELNKMRPQFERPNFREFSQWAKRHVNLQPHQLRDMWEDSVWSNLINATPERLAEWRNALGLEPKYGKGFIAPKRGPEAFQLPTEGNKIAARQNRATAEAAERYRNKVISAIAQKLIGESVEERAGLNRKEVTIDDIAFSDADAKRGAYEELNLDDIANDKRLKEILRHKARTSGRPESESRRLVAVVDRKTGAVELLSTYNDAGVQRVTDPVGARMTGKPSRELNKSFLSKYRPIASLLLTDPVKGFRQRFESAGEFADKIGKEAHERSAVGEFRGEGPAGEFTAEGTPGLQGEGGMFQGPHRTTMRRGAMESAGRLTRPEAEGVISHVLSEVGELDSPNDVKVALLGLLDKSARGRMRATDYIAQSGYRKMINALQREFPDRTREEVLDVMADRIYENNRSSETLEEYAQKTVAQFKGSDLGNAVQQAPAPQAGRELTMPIERVPPTTVRPEQLPPYAPEIQRAAPPPARLGSETPVRPRTSEERTTGEVQPEEVYPAAPSRIAREGVDPDTKSPIPRLVPNIDTAMTRAMGMERIPLIGRLWGERAKIKNESDRAMVGYSVKRSIGKSQAAITGAKLDAVVEQLATPYEQGPDGKLLNVNAKPKQSLYPSDLFEDWQRQVVIPDKMRASGRFSESEIAAYSEKNPIRFSLSKGQESQFREYLTLLEDGYKYLDEKNAKLETYGGESKDTRRRQQLMFGIPKGLEVHAMPRIAMYKREIGPIKTEIRRRIGGQYKIERDRLYRTEAEGQKTTAYEPDMNKRMVAFIERVYKAVADADLANNPALKGEVKGSDKRIQELAKEYEAEMRLPIGEEHRMTQKDIIDLSYQARLGVEGEVSSHPAFSDKVYPIDIANKLTKVFGDQPQRYVRTLSELNTISKTMMLTGDVAQYMQQGALLSTRRPVVWANATLKSLAAIADPKVTGRYLNNPENWKAATEFIQSGGSLGHLQDFMSGAKPGEFLTKIPILNQVITRSGRAFGTFQDIAKIEVWKAMRDSTPKEQWTDVIEQIENLGLSGKMEQAGLTSARTIGERLLLMAPAYYRGAMNAVAGAFEGGVAGAEARRSLGQYFAGWTAIMVSAYVAAGMSKEEIRHRLTPGQDNQKFMKFPVKVGDETVEIGPGGIMMSLLDLTADTAKATASGKNPVAPSWQWLQTRLGPVPAIARKAITGTDVFDRPTGPLEAAGSAAFPIPAQQGYRAARDANVGAGVLQAAASFTGFASKRYKASTEVYQLAKEFSEKEGLERNSGFDLVQNDDPSYTKLRGAVGAGSQSKFSDVYNELTKNRENKDIIKQMREWRDGPFTGAKKAEAAFKASLSDYQYDVYEDAKEERQRTYDKFLDMLSEVP